MPALDLRSTAPVVGKTYYLDTSGVMSLTVAMAIAKGANLPADTRVTRLAPFLSQAKKVGAFVKTTVLAIEELAAAVRNGERVQAAKARGLSWREYKRSYETEAKEADAKAQQKMLQMMEYAVNQLAAHMVHVVENVVERSQEIAAATEIRKAHRALLRNHVELDPMDALHIVVGGAIGADAFISFDAGWEIVPTITVLR